MITFNSVTSTTMGAYKVSAVVRPASPGYDAQLMSIVGGAGGAYYQRKNRQPLAIELRLWFRESSMANRRAKIRAVMEWLDLGEPAWLVVSDETTVRYEAVLVSEVPAFEPAGLGIVSLDFVFLVPSGYGVGTTQRIWDYVVPPLDVDFDNIGSAVCPALIRLTFAANVTDPKITLLGTGQFIEIVGTYGVADTLWIDTERFTVVNGTTDLRDKMTLYSEFFWLQPGTDKVVPANTNTAVRLYWFERWL